jgi:hypothetical protein
MENGGAIDYQSYVTERAGSFTGREWVFESIHSWLEQGSSSRYFLLTGEPGCGKTAVAARLTQFSQGDVAPPSGCDSFALGFLSAVHFCFARDSTWTDPRVFARSLSMQLLKGYPDDYASALAQDSERTRIEGKAEAGVAQTGAIVAGVYVQNLILSSLSATEAFNRSVRQPLENLYAQGFDQPVTILVDSLDEAMSYADGTTIVDLLSSIEKLPPPVRLVLTCRPDARIENRFQDADGLVLSAPEYDEENGKDIRAYLERRLGSEAELKVLVEALPPSRRDQVVATLAEKSDGNFLYGKFLLDGIARGQRSLKEIDRLPPGLDGLYADSLGRVIRLGKKEWSEEYGPVIGVLSVAQEALSLAQLQFLTEREQTRLWNCLSDLEQFIEPVEPPKLPRRHEEEAEQRYRLYHESVIDFLGRPLLEGRRKSSRNPYYLPAAEWHRRVADRYCAAGAGSWRAWDDYGLSHAPSHLAEAARRHGSPERHRLTERLVGLVAHRDFQEHVLERLDDLPALRRHLEQAVQAAALDTDDAALHLVVRSALAFVAFRRERLRPEQLFALARQGALEAAERQLVLFQPEPEWQQAVLLMIAWLGAERNPAAAHSLRDRIAGQLAATEPLPLLLTRVNAALDGAPLLLPPLDRVPTPEEVSAIVTRLGGSGDNGELLQASGLALPARGTAPHPYPAGHSRPQRGLARESGVPLDDEESYLAGIDGPLLTAYAAAIPPPEGDSYLRQYLAVHSVYHYAYYRNRSLWILLRSVLCHPLQDWVRDMAPLLAATALAGSDQEFEEGLEIALLALQARAGPGTRARVGALQVLEQGRERARAAAALLSPQRGKNDSWGTHRRRLATLAQVFTRLLRRESEGEALLDEALAVPDGFAGFQAPACLFLAEAIRVCRPDDETRISHALDRAEVAAHNVQDAIHCVRLTARVRAMREHWWPAGLARLDVEAFVRRLEEDPSSPEFSALHRVGEDYRYRSRGPHSLMLPEAVYTAVTLESLAELYERSVEEFSRLNPDWPAAMPLAPDTRVHVPDPGFAAQLAARLAAEILVADAPVDPRRVELIQSLVPRAAASSTILDTVLCRLLIAAHPNDAASLDELEQAAADYLRPPPVATSETDATPWLLARSYTAGAAPPGTG